MNNKNILRLRTAACFSILTFLLVAVRSPASAGENPATQPDDKPAAQASTAETIELPWIKGKFRHVLDPPGQKGDPKKRRWYINDHCFFVDKDDTIHWFGITNPYPKKGSYYGPGSHMHVGHASAKNPFGPWTEHKDAFTLPEGSKGFIGACFVMRHGDEYIMLLNEKGGFTIATSPDLHEWKRAEGLPMVNLGHGTRDPCVVKQDNGKYFLYATAGHGMYAAVPLAESRDMKTWKQLPPALVSDIRGKWGPLESPFVHRHGDAHYLFLNHSHHQYCETLVFRSESPYYFDWKRPVCTLFTHAAEIFEWKGKTYISHCGIEDRHWGKKTGLYLAELDWTPVEEDEKKAE